MKLIDAHIRNSVLLSMFVVLGLTFSLDFVFTLTDELGRNAQGYTALKALIYTLRIMPTGIYEMLPFTALGGALIGLGVLASNNELVVIQAAGVSTWRIVWSVMKPTIGIMILSLVMGEYVAPRLQQTAQSELAMIQSGGQGVSSFYGEWRKIGNEFIHLNVILPGGTELRGITRYELDENRHLLTSSFSESALYLEDDQGYYWQLKGVRETEFGFNSTTVHEYESLDWRVELSPELLSVLLVEPDRQSISGLYRFAEYFRGEGLESDSYFLSIWKKLLQPLATASLVLVAISFVFGPLRSVTMGARVFIAIGIGLLFTIAQRLLGPASLLYGFSPVVAVMIPIAVCFVSGIVLLRRI